MAAIEHRAKLEEHARRQDAATGMHIHPICPIQVERTGRDRRLPGVVHAEDAREYLMEHPDIGAEQIAVKTSTRDDLKEVDDAGGLLARDCQIRFIITKQALQEGWDCAFAYVLVNPHSPQLDERADPARGSHPAPALPRKTGDIESFGSKIRRPPATRTTAGMLGTQSSDDGHVVA